MFKGIFNKNEDEKFETYEEYEIDEIDTNQQHENKIKKIINVVFVILILIMIMIATDVICVARYNIGPFFAVRTSVYNDGGTKTYYGLGYKVIKYNQVQGRRDTKIGFWTMPYSTEPTTISSLDLAIEFTNAPEKTSKKYYKEFLRITGKVAKVDNKNKKLTMEYTDPDKKYTFRIICSMAYKKKTLNFENKQDITVIGTVKEFALKTENAPNRVYINDCFAE